MKRLPRPLVPALLLLAALVDTAGAARLEGRIVDGDDPVPGMRVSAHPQLDPTAEAVAVSAPSAADGRFRLELPQGSYALFARDAEGVRFAFCGRNPVAVEEGTTAWAGLQAVPVLPPEARPYGDEYAGAVEGEVRLDGRPHPGTYVYLYLDAADDLKGQGYRISPPTGADGRFAFDGLPESRYFLVARKRAEGGRVGPVQEGDLLGYLPANPLRVRAGQSLAVTVPLVRKLKEASGSELFGRGGGPVVRGRIVDGSGAAVSGLHVFAYTDRVIGHQRPAALSAPTGEDGSFTLELPAAGTYFIGARERYGDSPAPGERFGMYDETPDHGLTLEPGRDIDDVRIVVEPIRLD